MGSKSTHSLSNSSPLTRTFDYLELQPSCGSPGLMTGSLAPMAPERPPAVGKESQVPAQARSVYCVAWGPSVSSLGFSFLRGGQTISWTVQLRDCLWALTGLPSVGLLSIPCSVFCLHSLETAGGGDEVASWSLKPPAFSQAWTICNFQKATVPGSTWISQAHSTCLGPCKRQSTHIGSKDQDITEQQ